jgi:hypothetical protein
MGERAGTSRDAGSASGADDAPGQLANTDAFAIAVLVTLHRDHPRWAVWLPTEGQGWTAVRPASSRPPGPAVPMLWVHAGTAAELADRMRQADAVLSPG